MDSSHHIVQCLEQQLKGGLACQSGHENAKHGFLGAVTGPDRLSYTLPHHFYSPWTHQPPLPPPPPIHKLRNRFDNRGDGMDVIISIRPRPILGLGIRLNRQYRGLERWFQKVGGFKVGRMPASREKMQVGRKR